MKRDSLVLGVAGLFVFIGSGSFTANAAIAEGRAVIQPVNGDVRVEGTVEFEETRESMAVRINLRNATPGLHGVHLHEYGSCAGGGEAAGGHFNPEEVPHGYLPEDGFMNAHAGDFGNVRIGEDGTGEAEIRIPKLKKTGAGLTLLGDDYHIAGRAVVVHEGEDQFVQPAGDAGGRIGCGPVVLTAVGANSPE